MYQSLIIYVLSYLLKYLFIELDAVVRIRERERERENAFPRVWFSLVCNCPEEEFHDFNIYLKMPIFLDNRNYIRCVCKKKVDIPILWSGSFFGRLKISWSESHREWREVRESEGRWVGGLNPPLPSPLRPFFFGVPRLFCSQPLEPGFKLRCSPSANLEYETWFSGELFFISGEM